MNGMETAFRLHHSVRLSDSNRRSVRLPNPAPAVDDFADPAKR